MPDEPKPRPDRSAFYAATPYRALLGRIGANLRRLREARDLTQDKTADCCEGVDPTHIRRIEAGTTNVTVLTLSRLAEGLGVDPIEFLQPAAPLPKRTRGRPKKPVPPKPDA